MITNLDLSLLVTEEIFQIIESPNFKKNNQIACKVNNIEEEILKAC